MPRKSQIKKSEKRSRESADNVLQNQMQVTPTVDDKLPWLSVVNNLSSVAKGVARLQAATPTAERLEGLVAKNSKAKKYLVDLAAAQKRLCELMAEPAFEDVVTTNRASSLLAKWPGDAQRALWEALKEGDSTEVAMAIVKDRSCGLEKEARDLKVPLTLAVRAKRPDVVSALLVAGANPNHGDLESFETLLAAGARLVQSMMCTAARGGSADIIKLLADKGLSVKIKSPSCDFDESPIHIAAKEGHTAAVEDDTGNPYGTPFCSWSYVKSVEVAKLLTSYGAVIKLERLNSQFLSKPVLE